MRITKIEDLHCDAGWRIFSFLKISTDDDLVGWAEYNESYGNRGLTYVIRSLARTLIGQDPKPVERISAVLYAQTRQAPGGITHQAVAAILNALLDIKAKALDVPVYELFGGPVRDRLQVYWSHCGAYRLHHADIIGCKSLTRIEDMEPLGTEVAARGYKALKTNIYTFDNATPDMYMPGFARTEGFPELNPSRRANSALVQQISLLRRGAGADVELLVDLNFNFKTEGYVRMVRALDGFDIGWVELDIYEPDALAYIRRSASMPIASCESLFGRRQYWPFLEAGAVDVAIIDVVWNGMVEALKIASMADTVEVNVAPHNFYGHLATLMSAHFCATIPNFRIMEFEVDDVPWRDELVTAPPVIRGGALLLPTGPGWGADVNEDVVRAHPPRDSSYV